MSEWRSKVTGSIVPAGTALVLAEAIMERFEVKIDAGAARDIYKLELARFIEDQSGVVEAVEKMLKASNEAKEKAGLLPRGNPPCRGVDLRFPLASGGHVSLGLEGIKAADAESALQVIGMAIANKIAQGVEG